MTYLKRFHYLQLHFHNDFGISVQFKIVHFVHSCISAYCNHVIAAYSVYKKFLTLPLVRGSFASANFLSF